MRPALAVAWFCLLLAAPSTQAQSTSSAGPALSESELRAILRLSPLPPLPPDWSNAYADDPRAAHLGRRLFFDVRLSAAGTSSCATCHDPTHAWTDGRRTNDPGARFPRNVPSLRNTAYNRWYYWDGRADSAWAQALGPMEHERELGSDRLALLHLIRGDASLQAEYAAVFGPLPAGVQDPLRFPPHARPVPDQPENPLQQAWRAMSDSDRRAANVVFSNLGKAIAAFERTILMRETPFDRFVARLRQGDGAAANELSPSALRGLRLFIGRGQCILCHSGPSFTDGEFHDVGIALGRNHRVDPGRHRGVLTLVKSPFTRMGEYADVNASDAPVRFLTAQTSQLGQFKTPTLRGVAQTAPYMHDGRFDSLEQVLDFYSTRKGASPLGHPTRLLQPLNLDAGEIDDVVAFLHSLSAIDPEASLSD
jgi:cytochrome c peroxidase